jgi:hypothetical protein
LYAKNYSLIEYVEPVFLFNLLPPYPKWQAKVKLLEQLWPFQPYMAQPSNSWGRIHMQLPRVPGFGLEVLRFKNTERKRTEELRVVCSKPSKHCTQGNLIQNHQVSKMWKPKLVDCCTDYRTIEETMLTFAE